MCIRDGLPFETAGDPSLHVITFVRYIGIDTRHVGEVSSQPSNIFRVSYVDLAFYQRHITNISLWTRTYHSPRVRKNNRIDWENISFRQSLLSPHNRTNSRKSYQPTLWIIDAVRSVVVLSVVIVVYTSIIFSNKEPFYLYHWNDLHIAYFCRYIIWRWICPAGYLEFLHLSS